jgi:bacterioferritin-associated ferredoxin
MTRCECHEVEFEEVLRFSRITGEEHFETLIEKTGCGGTCTACHCDLKHALAEQKREEMEREPVYALIPVSKPARHLR